MTQQRHLLRGENDLLRARTQYGPPTTARKVYSGTYHVLWSQR